MATTEGSENKKSLKHYEERGVGGTKGSRKAKSVLKNTRKARAMQKTHEQQVAEARLKAQSTDSNQ